MDIRLFDKNKDYDTLCQWWDDWDQPVHLPEALSDTGIIISKEGVDICMSFIYSTDSYICWMEFLVMNKRTTREQRKGVLRKMFETLLEKSKLMGFKIVMTFGTEEQSSKAPVLTKLKKEFFDITTKDMIQYYKIIN